MANGDEAGAIAAVKYFLELYAYAFGSGDTAEFAAMSSPGCDFCSNTLDAVTALHETGGTAFGGEPLWEEESFVVAEVSEGVFSVDFNATQEELTILSADGSVLSQTAPTRYTMLALLTYSHACWSVAEFGGDSDA